MPLLECLNSKKVQLLKGIVEQATPFGQDLKDAVEVAGQNEVDLGVLLHVSYELSLSKIILEMFNR